MCIYPEITVDIQPQPYILYFYTIFGGISLIFNSVGVYLICKNSRIFALYKGFLLSLQVHSLISNAHLTLFMQPILLFPILAGYTNGILWRCFEISSHVQMGIFQCILYSQIASIIVAILAKYRIIAQIGNSSTSFAFFWIFITSYHSMAIIIFIFYYFSNLNRQQMTLLLETKFPSATNILTLPNVDIYDMATNIWFEYTVITIVFMLLLSAILSVYLSYRLFVCLHKKRRLISERHFKNHRSSIISLYSQSALPMIVVIIPMAVLNYFFVRVTPNSQSISNLMMIIYSFHSFSSTLVMILSNASYRKKIKSKLRSNSSTSPTFQKGRSTIF